MMTVWSELIAPARKASKTVCFFDFGNHHIQKPYGFQYFFGEACHFDNTVIFFCAFRLKHDNSIVKIVSF